MANIYNFGLAGVSSGVQFGKRGTQILSNSGTFSAVAADGSTLVQFQIADPVGLSDGVTLGVLRSAANTLNANTSTLSTEVRGIETGSGLGTGTGNYTADSGSNYLTSVTSLVSADSALDAAIKSVQDELDTVESAIGLNSDGTFASFSGTSLLDGTSSIAGALTVLDGAINTGNSAVTTEMHRALDAEAALSNAISDEATRAVNAEALLNSNIISNASTLTTAINLVQSNVTANVTSIYTMVADTNANVVAEFNRANTAESLLQTAIINEASAARAYENSVQSAVNFEVSRATVAEGALSTRITAEANTARSAEGTLTTNLGNEVTRASDAEANIAANVAGEITRATTAEHILTNAVADEVSRAEGAEGVLSNAVSAIQGSYIHKDGSVAFTGDQAMGGFLLTGLGVGSADGDAVNFQALRDAVSGLGSAFAYVGTVGSTGANANSASDISGLSGPGGANLAAGDYYKVNGTDGWLSDGTNPAFFVHQHDGIVYNNTGGWDVIAHVDSVVQGDPGTITVTGSVDTGFMVSIDAVFQNTVSSLQSNTAELANAISAETLRAGNAEGVLSNAISDEFARANAAESTLTTNLGSEVGRAEAAEGVLTNAIAAEVTRATTAEGAITNTITQNVIAAQLGNALVRANIALMDLSIGLSNIGGYIVPTNSAYLDTTTSVMTALMALDVAANTNAHAISAEVTRATDAEAALANSLISNVATINQSFANVLSNVAGNVANAIAGNSAMGNTVNSAVTILNNTINMVQSNVTSNVMAIYTEIDEIETSVGLGSDGSLPAFSGTNYLDNTTTLLAAISALDTGLAATANSLSYLSQDQIVTTSTKSSVKVDDTLGVVTKLSVGGVATQVANMIAGANTNTTLTTDFSTANQVNLIAGGTGDVDIHIEPAGSGQVFIGATGVAGVMQGEPGQQLTIAGGSSANLILSGGATSGLVQITDGSAKNVATFSGVANASAYLSMVNGTGSATIGAAGSASSVDLVLSPKGTGVISASSAKIVNVATATLSTDATNLGQVNSAISSAVNSAKTNALYAVSVNITETDGAVAIGSAVSGTVVRVRVIVGTAFNTASVIEVGTTASGSDLMDPSLIDGSLAGQAFVTDAATSVTATQLYASVVTGGGGSSGTATVLVEYLHA